MAFNPFRAFRKHQKVMFAALTILSMVVFVLTGSMAAGWDFFMGFMQIFGATSRSGGVASVYGRDYDARDLQNLRRSRQVANHFMAFAVATAEQQAQSELFTTYVALQRGFPDLVQRFQMLVSQSPPPSPGFQEGIERIANHPELSKKTEGIALLRRLATLEQAHLALRMRQAARRGGSELYFGGSSRMSTEELVDFLIWRRQADNRHIRFTPEDVQDLVNRETEQLLSTADFADLDQKMHERFGPYTRSDFLSALADEFRVRVAQEALGYADTAGSDAGDNVTPYQLWDYYKEARTRARVAVVDLPVRSPKFLAGIGTPREEELKALYERYKNQEYSPESPDSGFKQPPRIRVEWVRPRLEHFRAAARRTEAVAAAAQQVVAGLRPGVMPWEPLLPGAIDSRLVREYEDAKYLQYRAPSLTSGRFALPYLLGANRPENVAAAAGAAVGAVGTRGAGVLAGVASYAAGGVARLRPDAAAVLEQEKQRRTAVGVTLILAGASPEPLGPAALWATAERQEQYLPLSLVKQELAERVENDLARKMSAQAVEELRQELEVRSKLKNTEEAFQFLAANRPPVVASALGLAGAASLTPAGAVAPALLGGAIATAAPPVTAGIRQAVGTVSAFGGPLPWSAAVTLAGEKFLPAALARAVIDRATADGAFEDHSSKNLCDAYDIAQDPGLRPLRTAYDLQQSTPDPTGRLFAAQFFNDKAQPLQTSLYVPQTVGGQGTRGSDETYLFWNVAEQPSYVPTFAEARERVVQRWQLEKARPAAKAEAEKLAHEAERGGKPEQNLQDAASALGQKVFYLDDVAPLVPAELPAVTSLETVRRYKRYEIPEYQREYIEYPTSEMAKQLLKLRDGKTAVLEDRPGANFFVATPVWRLPPQVSFFYDDYSKLAVRMQLLSFMEQDTHYRESFRSALMAELRAQAKVHLNERPAASGPAAPAPVDEGD